MKIPDVLFRKETILRHTALRCSIALFVLLNLACFDVLYAAGSAADTSRVQSAASYFNIPIKIGYDKMDQFIDSSMRSVLYEDSTEGSLVRVKKYGRMSIAGKEDSAEISLPLRVWYKKKIGPTEFSTDFDLVLRLSLKLSVKGDWKLLTQTRLIDYKISRAPAARLAGLEWDFSFLLKQILKYALPRITTKIDESMAESALRKQYAVDMGRETGKPMMLDTAYKAWIGLQPGRFYYIPVRFLKKEMLINAAMDGVLKMGMGEVPPAQKEQAVSKLILKDSLPEFFSTRLNLEIPLTSLENALRLSLIDTVIPLSKRKEIKIDDIRLFQMGEKLGCRLMVSGSYRFDLLLHTRLIFSDSLQAFRAADLEYNVESKQLLIKAADLLFENKIKSKIYDALQYDPKADIRKATEGLSKFLNNYNYENKLLVKGGISQIKFSGIKCENSLVTGVLNVMGKAQISVIGMGK